VQLFSKLNQHTGTYYWVSWCRSLSSYTYSQEPSLGPPCAALFQAINSHWNLLLGNVVHLLFKLYQPTGTYSLVSWRNSLSSCKFTQEPTLGYTGAALFQAIPTHRNQLLGILVQLFLKLYPHAGTYSWVSWCSSISSYTYTQEPTIGYPCSAINSPRSLLSGILVHHFPSYTYTQEPTLFQALHTHRNLLSGILVQLYFKLYLHTGTYFWVSWCSLFQAIPTHRNLLSGILVKLYFKQYQHKGTYSRVSWCSSLSSYTYTQEPTLGYPGATLFQALNSHRNVL